MRAFCAIFFLVLSASLFAQSPQRIEATRMVQMGDNYLQRAQHQEAIFQYTNAIVTDPSYTEALIKRASIYERLGMTTEARKDLENAKRINPYSTSVLDANSKFHILSDDYDIGLKHIDEAMGLEPENLSHLDRRVDASILKGCYSDALEDVEVLIEQSYHPELSQLKKALTLYLNEDLSQAKSASMDLLVINDSNVMALEILGLIALKESENDSALMYFDQALAIFPTASLYYNKGIALRLKGNQKEALENFNVAINMNLDSARSYVSRGDLLQEMGKFSSSILDFSEVEESDPVYFEAMYRRAYSHQMLGDLPSALNDASMVVELRPRDAESWALRGDIYLLFGEYDNAIDDYLESLKWNYQKPEVRFNLALAMLLDHRLREGCIEMRRAVDEGYTEGERALSNFCGP